MDENIMFGRYCQSGVAVITASENKMMCVRIDNIKSNYEKWQKGNITNQNQPACYLVKAEPDACQYQYIDKDGVKKLINQDYCECSLMKMLPPSGKREAVAKKFDLPSRDPLTGKLLQSYGSQPTDYGVGYCPTPPQKRLDAYIGNLTKVLEAARGRVHTFDRDNIEDFYSLVLSETINRTDFMNTVQTRFDVKFWPFLQSNMTRTCVNIAMKESPENMNKLSAF